MSRLKLNLQLMLVSAYALFLELMLIRWVGSEISVFAYLQSTVLVVCFMGLGMGCFSSRSEVKLRSLLVPLTIIVALLSIPPARILVQQISVLLSALDDFVIWGFFQYAPNWRSALLRMTIGLVITFVILFLIWQIFVPLGRILGRLLDTHPRAIEAYSVNIAGSLAGVWAFVWVSALSQPPLTWFFVLVALQILLILNFGEKKVADLVLSGLILAISALASYEPQALEITWSPYQKLVMFPGRGGGSRYLVEVNNTSFQVIKDLSEPARTIDARLEDHERAGYSFYDIPLLLHPQAHSFLVVGAGTGNDVAAALRNGVKEVTAVEIDPVIIKWGETYHPEKPYQASQVTIVNEDARAFFSSSSSKYDVVSFGLLDSHTHTGLTTLRLDNYVYTEEALRQAKILLKPAGVMTLTFWVPRDFVSDRFARMLKDIFDEPPLVIRFPIHGQGGGPIMFISGDANSIQAGLKNNAPLGELIAKWEKESPLNFEYTTRKSTDDWPYLYHEHARIPTLYYLLGLMLVLMFSFNLGKLGLRSVLSRWNLELWHFFFLGAAFLLLELHNISKASLAFGSTWQVNAVIISGVLVMALGANLIISLWPRLPRLVPGLLLVASCLVVYFVDFSYFNSLPYASRVLSVGLLTALPMLFSGMVFIRSFAATARRDSALGANLFGSMAGALCQALAFVAGIKALLLLVSVFYICALICGSAKRW